MTTATVARPYVSSQSEALDSLLAAAPTGDVDSAGQTAWAVSAARAGLALMLCAPDTKIPWDTRTPAMRKSDADSWESQPAHLRPPTPEGIKGLYVATRDSDRIRALLDAAHRQRPAELPNLALHVGRSRLIIIDVDTPEEVAAFRAWAAERDPEHASFWATVAPTVTSPGTKDDQGQWQHHGGGHFWLTLPEGTDLATADLPADLTIKHGDSRFSLFIGARYVLVPPSRRAEGPYRVTGRVLAAPGWLGEYLAAEAERYAAPAEPVDVAEELRDALAAAALTWAPMLTELRYTESGADSCGCATWQRPGGSSLKSVTAHERGCTSQYHGGSDDPPLIVWTDAPGPEIESALAMVRTPGGRAISRLQLHAAMHHDGDVGRALRGMGVDTAGEPCTGTVLDLPLRLDDAPAPAPAPAQAAPAPASDTWPEGHPNDPALMGQIFDLSEVTRTIFWAARASAVYVPPTALLLHQCVLRGALAGPDYTTETADTLGLFVAVAGPSGAGKSTALDPRRLPHAQGVMRAGGTPVTLPGMASGQAVIDALTELVPAEDESGDESDSRGKPKMRLQMRAHAAATIREDEITALIAKGASASSTLIPTLLSAWAGAQIGDLSRTHGERVTSGPYVLSLVGGIQPALAAPLVSGDAAVSGLAQRLLFTATDDPWAAGPQPVQQVTLPEQGAPVLPNLPLPGQIGLPPSARDALAAHRAAAASWAAAGDPLDAHALRVRIRVATLGALLHGEAEVSEALWAWAGALMEHHRRSRAAVIATAEAHRLAKVAQDGADYAHGQAAGREAAAESVGEAAVRILRVLAEEGTAMPTGKLRKRLTGRLRPYAETALAQLVRAGRISPAQGAQGATVYALAAAS